MLRFLLLLSGALALASCTSAAPGGVTPAPTPAGGGFPSDVPAGGESRVALPPIPRVDGRLSPRIVYPRAEALIQARDSNFVFGNVGRGDAKLTINGIPVEVMPNGSYLAWLPVPPADAPRYELLATSGADTVRVWHPVRLLGPVAAYPDTGRLAVGEVAPTGVLLLREDEPVRVTARAPANARLLVRLNDGREVPMLRGPERLAAVGRSGGDSTSWAAELTAGVVAPGARLVARRGRDSVVAPLAAVVLSDTARTLVRLGSAAAGDTDRVVIGRPVPGGTYAWFLLPGTVVPLTGRQGAWSRVRLDAQVEAWVANEDIEPVPAGIPAPRRVAGNVRVVSAPEWVDLVVPVGERAPHRVEERDDELVLTLHGVTANTDVMHFLRAQDSLVRAVTYESDATDRARYTLQLSQRPFGYQVLWSGSAMVLRVRRTPVVSAKRPLAGLVIAIDPGHPPIGSTGPTGLWEPEATLPVGLRVRQLLEERGARVVLTRTTPAAVALGDRPVIARQANAHAFVSIHYNALPDGVNPRAVERGTGTYFFFAHSASLARAVQRGMVRRMGLRDEGVFRQNFAVVRNPWFPAVLAEGAFIMLPEQEAALRDPAFQERYALGIVEGLEEFFRGMAR